MRKNMKPLHRQKLPERVELVAALPRVDRRGRRVVMAASVKLCQIRVLRRSVPGALRFTSVAAAAPQCGAFCFEAA